MFKKNYCKISKRLPIKNEIVFNFETDRSGANFVYFS